MGDEKAEIFSRCASVLDTNWRHGYTVPSAELYPHQWLWDSCFVAIGLRHINISRAKKELKSLKRGAWSNGMLPNIIFNDDYLNFDHVLWESKKFPEAPRDVNTGGITQPPLLAEAVLKVGNELDTQERLKWFRSMYGCLLNYHQWLYNERDYAGDGLIALIHPYESGLDNTPAWIHALQGLKYPWWLHAAHSHSIGVVLNHLRRDTVHIPKSQRMGLKDALECFYAIRQLKKQSYKFVRSLPKNQMAVQDVVFNSIFIRANRHLLDIANQIGETIPAELLSSMKKSEKSFHRFWNDEHEEYFSINLMSSKQLKQSSLATLMPLYGGAISQQRANTLVRKLFDKELFNPKYPVPSVPVRSKRFSPEKYWQGPTWLNTNWLIIQGLKNYGFDEEAADLAQRSIELLENSGMYEYFSPLDGKPEGAKNFSWTASLTIDLLQEFN